MRLRITKWNENFETAKTRTYKNKNQGAFPIDMNSNGYRRIMREKDGPAIYGCFISLCMLAHSVSGERQGYLTDTTGDYDIESISVKTDMPEKLIKRTVEVCSDVKIGWLVNECKSTDYNATDTTGIAQETIVPLNINLNTNTNRDIYLADSFELFRKRYPGTKRGHEVEFEHLKKKHGNWRDIVPLLLDALDREQSWRDSRGDNEFVPPWKNMQTWINQSCWTQEFSQDTSPAARAEQDQGMQFKNG